MKAKYLLFGIMALALLSCDKIINGGKIWDISPVVVIVQVANANGIDLLNPDNQNSYAAGSIKAVYNGKEYECNKSISDANTKAYHAQFYGLKTDKNYVGNYSLFFGEFDGAKSYSNEEVTILWGDGSSDKIKFSRKFRWTIFGDPNISEDWYLNGTKVSDGVIKIVK